MASLRNRGPLVWVENYGGYWAATSYELVRQMAQDWQTFSSAQGVAILRPDPEVMPYIMPIDYDPPRQRVYRRMLNPHLGPKDVAPLEEAMRQIADELIDSFIEQGHCDFATDFARRYPGTVFFRLVVGATDDELAAVEPWARAVSFDPDPAKKAEGVAHLREWVIKVFEERRQRDQADDVVGAVMRLTETGTDFTDEELYSGLQILVMGGLGTSADLIGATVVLLSEHTDLQGRARDDLSLVVDLMEEVLRLEPPVVMEFRTATRDVDIAGKHVKKGDKVGLFFGAANRDPAAFERADEVELARSANPHLAFGAGVHRCIGSHLARLQVRVAVEQVLERLSPFRIPDGGRVEYISDQERGPSSIPLEFRPGPRRSAGNGGMAVAGSAGS